VADQAIVKCAFRYVSKVSTSLHGDVAVEATSSSLATWPSQAPHKALCQTTWPTGHVAKSSQIFFYMPKK